MRIKGQFDVAVPKHAWTLGYKSFDHDSIQSGSLQLEGSPPLELRGTFYRNGPARHEIGGWRYAHAWDGDGMVQAFRFSEQGISHLGRYVHTAKFLSEQEAGRPLVSTFGSRLPGNKGAPKNLDTLNVANLSVCRAGGELLALWEAGSAYRIDPDTLATLGLKHWPEGGKLRPFSAHPHQASDGVLWNFGCNPQQDRLHLYAIDAASGRVLHRCTLDVPQLPPLHDFAITRDHLVFVLPPMICDLLSEDRSFGQSLRWVPERPTRVLVVRKSDWTLTWFTLPPMHVMHVVNAWDNPDGSIEVIFPGSTNSAGQPNSGWAIMRGRYAHVSRSVLHRARLLRDGAVELEALGTDDLEFPVLPDGESGQPHSRVLALGRSDERPSNMPGWDRILLLDRDGAVLDRYCYGDDWMVEEHVFAHERWVVGTALNLKARATVVSVFDSTSLSSGPVARATLPYALPVGLHGLYVAA
jgi:carotenoid cleavage dioxygenase